MEILCKICNQASNKFDANVILNKYDVNYWHCPKCGFVQTDDPFWIEEAYRTFYGYECSSEMSFSFFKTTLIQNNIENANILCFFMRFIPNGICMDFGGGKGVLTRIMRDYGFDFYHYDKYCENEFAIGFEADISKKYTLVTAFEVFEHFSNPLEEIDELMNMTDVLFFSTCLITPDPPLIKDWRYYDPNSGRHISFYSLKTLNFLAKKFGCQLLTNGYNLHILSKTPISMKFFKLLGIYNRIRNKLDITRKFKKEAKTSDDYELAVSQIIKKINLS